MGPGEPSQKSLVARCDSLFDSYLAEEERRGGVSKELPECASKIWKLLGETGQVNVLLLPEALSEKSKIVSQALHLLQREETVVFIKENGQRFVSLTDSEKEIYKDYFC